jgi:hypothetical protein
MKEYRWITKEEGRIHYISELMSRLKETGYEPPFGWEWGYWPKWLLDSTIAHFFYKTFLDQTRKLEMKLVFGKPEHKGITHEEREFLQDNTKLLTEKAYDLIENAGAFVVKRKSTKQ